jgi:hypothetical protein
VPIEEEEWDPIMCTILIHISVQEPVVVIYGLQALDLSEVLEAHRLQLQVIVWIYGSVL